VCCLTYVVCRLDVVTSGVPKSCAVVLAVEKLRPNMLISESVLLGNLGRSDGSVEACKTLKGSFVLLSGLFFSRERK
jgi:hypothetical protein